MVEPVAAVDQSADERAPSLDANNLEHISSLISKGESTNRDVANGCDKHERRTMTKDTSKTAKTVVVLGKAKAATRGSIVGAIPDAESLVRPTFGISAD